MIRIDTEDIPNLAQNNRKSSYWKHTKYNLLKIVKFATF